MILSLTSFPGISIHDQTVYGIIGTFLGAAFLTICGFLFKKWLDKRKRWRAFFKIGGKKSSKLKAADIMGIRADETLNYNAYY